MPSVNIQLSIHVIKPPRLKGQKEQHMPDEPIEHEAKIKFPETVKYNRIALEATVVSKPNHEATIIKGNARIEVTVRANLHNGDSSHTYTLRFVDARFLMLAKQLQPGCRIRIHNGKFKKRHGRDPLECEFEVKAFDVVRGELRSALPPRRTNSRRRKYLKAIRVKNWTVGFQEPTFTMNNLPKPRSASSQPTFNAGRFRIQKLFTENRNCCARLTQPLNRLLTMPLPWSDGWKSQRFRH